ncbi:MAG: HAD family hydrolase [Actinomycetales bacterium]|nr:HAD family hydrolase [Actinomycetales bacterium]
MRATPGERAIEAVIFDWGGTLTPWHEIDLHAQWYAYAEIYDPPNASSLAQELADAEMQRWRRQQASQGAVSTGALEALFLDRGIDTTSARHLRALGSYLDFWAPHTLADPDAHGLLRALREMGLRVGVLSNTMWPRTHHQEVFARDDLLDLIDAAAYTSEMQVAKPHSEAFAAICAALDVAPGASVFVGDRLWDDILGAQQAGMRTVWIPHSRIPDDQVPDASAVPDAVAHRLGDVLGIVTGWLGQHRHPAP